MKPLSDKLQERKINLRTFRTDTAYCALEELRDFEQDIKQALKEFKDKMQHPTNEKIKNMKVIQERVRLTRLLYEIFGTLADEEPKTEVEE